MVVSLLGLLLSGLFVLSVLLGLGLWAGGQRQAEMRALHASLPVYAEASLIQTHENWDNLVLYWQGESVLPRIVSEFYSEHPIGAVMTFYKEQLTAAGWQEYKEPWSLYPAYKRGPYRIAILFDRPFAQDWLPAENYAVHLWSLPLLEETLGRDAQAEDRAQ